MHSIISLLVLYWIRFTAIESTFPPGSTDISHYKGVFVLGETQYA